MSALPITYNTTIIRMSGRSLVIARSLWLVVCLAATLTFLFALPFRWTLLTHPSPTNLANLTALGLTPTFFAAYSVFWEIVIAVPNIIVGFVIFWRCGEERIALLTSLMLIVFGVGSGTLTPTIRALGSLHPAIDFLQRIFEFLAWYSFALFFYLFPNGRFVPGWTRWLAIIFLPIFILWNFASDSPFAPLNWPPYLSLPFIIILQWGTWFFSQVYRYRRASNAIERQQTKWVVFAVVVLTVFAAVSSFIGAFVPGYNLTIEEQPNPQSFAYMLAVWLFSPVMMLLPIAIAFSILRYRLWDIDLIISRALVYSALTVIVAGIYIAIVGGLGIIFQGNGVGVISLLATGLVAVIFQPMRDRLQRGVNRLLYGERDDPYAVLSRFGQNLESTLAADSILPAIVETIAHTLKLPYCAITFGDADSAKAAAFGSPTANVIHLPLSYQSQVVGQLHVAQRAPDEPFADAELRLLEDIARQAGVAIHNMRLTIDLQLARERLVTTREEERRRLRRDLHDGLGPKLAGQILILEVVRDSLHAQPESRALVEHLIEDSQTVVSEVRQLVHGLRPPALDEYGLVGAVRAYAAQCEAGGLRVRVSAPESVSPLPAAVEVAAYRIAQESITNVVRHSQAKNCSVTLTMMGGNLKLEISDDGVGLSLQRKPGVGLASMRERAEEIGGWCVVENGENGGARVTAQLPVSHHG